MTSPFDFGDVEISHFTADETAKFLRSLLAAEATTGGMGLENIHVPIKVNVPDGGIDAVAENESRKRTSIIPNGKTGYQLKRSDLSPKECEEEVLDGDSLKEIIQEILKEDGTYALVIFEDLTDRKIKNRRERLEDTFASHGFDSAAVEIFDSSKLVTIAQQYPSLAVRYNPQVDVGIDFDTWSERQPISLIHNYVHDGTRMKDQDEIRQKLSSSTTSLITRITGLSGVGKSRFLYETLNEEGLRGQVIHASENSLKQSRLIQYLETDSNVRCILVVDDCSPKYHESLVSRFQGRDNQAHVITLSDSLKEVNADISVELEPLSADVVEELITSERPDLNRNAVSKIVEFSDGFLGITATLLPTIEFGGWNSELDLPAGTLMDKLLVGTSKKEDRPDLRNIKKTLEAFAMFERVGWKDQNGNLSDEFDEIYKLFELGSVGTKSEVSEIVTYAKKRGLLRGQNALSLQPLPLALLLIKSRLERDRISSDLLEVSPGLIRRAERRIPYFNAFESGSDWAADVLSRRGWFRNTALLETDSGSRIFKALARASAEDGIKVLDRFFRERSISELRDFKEGRRAVVRALRGIAIWDATFDDAARYLRKLAIAENEQFANNATGIYTDLFSPVPGQLSPTERRPADRLHHIEEGLKRENELEFDLAVNASKKALKTRSYQKTGNPERQGARELPNFWHPNSNEEWVSYFELAWNTLVEHLFKLEENERRNRIIDVLSDAARGYVSLSEELNELVQTSFIYLCEADWADSQQIISTIVSINEFEAKNLNEESRQFWADIEDWAANRSYHSKFVRYAAVRQMKRSEEAKEKWERKRAELADKAASDIQYLRREYDLLFQNDIVKGYDFGQKVAKKDSGSELINEILDELAERRPPQLPSFVIGYLLVVEDRDPSLYDEILEKMQKEPLQQYYPTTVRIVSPTEVRVQEIIEGVEEGELDIGALREFGKLPSPQKAISEEVLQRIARHLLDSDSQSAHIALELLYSFYVYPEDNPRLDLEFLLDSVTHENVLVLPEQGDFRTRTHEWQKTIEEILDRDPELAPDIIEDVIDASVEDGNLVRLSSHHSGILSKCVEVNPDGVWKVVSNKLEKDDFRAWWTTQWLSGNLSLSGPIFHRFDWEDVCGWIEQNPVDNAPFVANSMGIHLPDEPTETTLTREMLVEYGHLNEVRRALQGTYLSGHWTGSSEEHYKQKLEEIEYFLSVEEMRETPSESVFSWGDSLLDTLEERIARAAVNEELLGRN